MNISEFIRQENEKRITECVTIPEWGNEKVFYQTINAEEYSKISKSLEKDQMMGMIDAIIMKAEYEDGRRMFTMADRGNLSKYKKPSVIIFLAGKILDTLSPGEAEKN